MKIADFCASRVETSISWKYLGNIGKLYLVPTLGSSLINPEGKDVTEIHFIEPKPGILFFFML
jgi:hypothetical protein